MAIASVQVGLVMTVAVFIARWTHQKTLIYALGTAVAQ